MQVTCGSGGHAFGRHNPLRGCGYDFCFGCLEPLIRAHGPYDQVHSPFCYYSGHPSYNKVRLEAKIMEITRRYSW